jgi:deoxyribonuclease-4
VSIAGGIQESVLNAKKLGCTAFQIFTRNPRGWAEKKLPEDTIEAFKANLKESGIERDSVAANTGFLVNLSAPSGELHEKSVDSLTNELLRCSQLGIKYLVVDFGSHMGAGRERGLEQVVTGCERAVDNYKSTFSNNLDVTVLFQNSAGHKNSVGSKLEELRETLDKLPSEGYGICLDTCHAFTAGYDLRTKEACLKFIDEFNDVVGINTLELIHLNDSKKELGSCSDRHEHIGLGSIGLEGLGCIINHDSLRDLPMIMQTPTDSIRNSFGNLQLVLKLRKEL